MTPNPTRSFFSISFVLLMLFSAFIPTGSVRALTSHVQSDSLVSLEMFVNQVKNGQADEMRGIYIPETLAAHIVLQPAGKYEFVSSWPNVVTQFDLASKRGSTGLLAHNYLAGKSFLLLKENQKIYLVYGDGKTSAFVVREILRYQALTPTSASSNFIDLENGDLLTASELFLKVYDRPGQIIFQTCITEDHNPAWGRMFIIAEPYSQNP
jgi:hypothetical protein